MDRATPPPIDDEIRRASHALAAFFGGVVLVEDADGSLRVDPAQTEDRTALQRQEAALLVDEALEPGLLPESDPEQLDLFLVEEAVEQAPGETQLLVSLAQLRQWYTIARDLKRPDRLSRIVELGRLFKQTFGETAPDQLYPFTAWSAEEVEWWLEDLAAVQPSQLVQPSQVLSHPGSERLVPRSVQR